MNNLIIGVSIIGIFLLSGCKEPHLVEGTSEYKAQQDYLALKEARLKREAAGNYTGYPVGSAEYKKRSAPGYDAKLEKRRKELASEWEVKHKAFIERKAIERAEASRQQAYYTQQQRKSNNKSNNEPKYTNTKMNTSSFTVPNTGVDRVTSFGNGMYSYESGGDNISFKPASF